MAIALGQPVDEISHGLEVMKISQVMASERAPEAQVAPSADVRNVQALPVEGPGSPVGEEALRVNSSEVSCAGQSMMFPFMEFAHPCIDYSDGSQFQGPVYTGYPAPVVNVPGYMPFSADGVILPNPVVEYNPVYNQNIYCSAPCNMGQFNYGFGQPYAYPPYQLVPQEQCSIAAPLHQSEGTMIPEGFFVPSGYQHVNLEVENGQFLPMANPLPVCNMPGYFSVPYPPVNTSHVLSASSPAWVQQLASVKGLNEEPKHIQPKSGLQHCNDGSLNKSKSSFEKVDIRVPMVDVKKQSKKQWGAGSLYGVSMPIKGSWVRAGPLPCENPTQLLKPLSGNYKVPCASPLSVEQCNMATFSTDFEDALHFIIKSFSDENVYRSVQHGVWASTPHGNKKLNEAYEDAQRRAVGKAKGCPVFLYFSVNGSGRFCGVAEMIGPVDFNNTMDFWERNRWCGSFPVKWHFIKDVPHCQLRRIILQNNENKPVTSSRDTQEVNFEQGLLVLNIMKNFSTAASILDNFPDYLGLQKGVPHMKVEQQSSECSAGNSVVPPDAVSAVLESDNALKVCNGEVKASEDALQEKANQGQAETLSQDGKEDNGGGKLDKENVRICESV